MAPETAKGGEAGTRGADGSARSGARSDRRAFTLYIAAAALAASSVPATMNRRPTGRGRQRSGFACCRAKRCSI
jgi:hypothetical protein